jgi:hypothetical protein
LCGPSTTPDFWPAVPAFSWPPGVLVTVTLPVSTVVLPPKKPSWCTVGPLPGVVTVMPLAPSPWIVLIGVCPGPLPIGLPAVSMGAPVLGST